MAATFFNWMLVIFGSIFGLMLLNVIFTECADRAKKRAAAQKKADAEAEKAAKRQAAEAKRQAETAEAQPEPDAPRRGPGRPRKPENETQPAPEAVNSPQLPKGNGAFAGHIVAFTGRLDGLTRDQAISAVQANGGQAFRDMYVGTTLLVVADSLMRSGRNTGKLDKADQWIGQVKKITEAQFKEMLNRPLTLTPEEFAALTAA